MLELFYPVSIKYKTHYLATRLRLDSINCTTPFVVGVSNIFSLIPPTSATNYTEENVIDTNPNQWYYRYTAIVTANPRGRKERYSPPTSYFWPLVRPKNLNWRASILFGNTPPKNTRQKIINILFYFWSVITCKYSIWNIQSKNANSQPKPCIWIGQIQFWRNKKCVKVQDDLIPTYNALMSRLCKKYQFDQKMELLHCPRA